MGKGFLFCIKYSFVCVIDPTLLMPVYLLVHAIWSSLLHLLLGPLTQHCSLVWMLSTSLHHRALWCGKVSSPCRILQNSSLQLTRCLVQWGNWWVANRPGGSGHNTDLSSRVTCPFERLADLATTARNVMSICIVHNYSFHISRNMLVVLSFCFQSLTLKKV